MAFLSEAQARIRPSATIAMSNLAARLRAEGADVIALSAGEPDFDTPEHVRAAAIAAIEAGQTRYTAVDGTPELKAAIAAKFVRENGLEYAPEEIIVSAGGKQVLFNALMATLDPGDEVIIPAPYWVSYPEMVRLAGARPVIVSTRAEDGFRLAPEALEAAITARSKWLILNSPANPTGAGYDAARLGALLDVVRRHERLWILSDDIYEHITFDDFAFCTPAQLAPDLKGRILTMNGVSKAYAMTGWRIGYGAGPAELIAAMRKIQSQSTSCPSAISQAAAQAALEGPQDFLEEWRESFRRRRDLVLEALAGIEGIACPRPQGAFYLFPMIEGLIGRRSPEGREIASDADFTEALLREAGVALVPGAAFGLSPAMRISYASGQSELREACRRIGDFCAALV